jgi:hypothetical protein
MRPSVRLCWLASLLLVPAWLTGCSSSKSSVQADPLFGDPKNAGPAAGPAKAEATVPPIPSIGGPLSTAALAANSPLPNARPLAIGQPEPLINQSAPQTTLTSANSNDNVPFVTRPLAIVPPQAPAAIQPASSWNSAPQTLPKELRDQLASRGVTWQKIDSIPGGCNLKCIVPNRFNPSISRVFEVQAADVPSAVAAILRQIDDAR